MFCVIHFWHSLTKALSTDGRTKQPTDKAFHRDARMQIKTFWPLLTSLKVTTDKKTYYLKKSIHPSFNSGKMALQEACAVQECERDICAKDDEPSECPCTDEACRKKRGGQEGFVFLYPPTDKIKLDDKGCPLQQQMRCVVTQIGDVSQA